ncbi:hypothetical protein D3C86_1222710 [compost metagenome]
MAGVVRGGGVDERLDEALLADFGVALDRGRAGVGRGVDHFLAGLGALNHAQALQFLQRIVHQMGVFDIQREADVRQFLAAAAMEHVVEHQDVQ